MTPQMEANELLITWQRNRHLPPEFRLIETKDEIMGAFDRTIAMLVADDQKTLRGEV